MVYAFADCGLDTQRITLRRAGQTMPLRPKVFQVLLHLLTHRERVVDKQELCEQVWPEQCSGRRSWVRRTSRGRRGAC
jgi:DNA-binding winged helix-turn-helix (wHTH) protein